MSKKFSSKFKEDFPLAKFDTNYFGLTSDWHIGNKFVDEDKIIDYLDYLRERGIKEIFHGGDLFEGTNIYSGQLKTLKPYCDTIKGQMVYFNEMFPEQKDFQMNIIAGNHDKKGKQTNQVKRLSSEREDINYLGRFSADVELKDNIRLSLIHPSRNSNYPSMHKPQNYLKELVNPPNILGIGHIHRADENTFGEVKVYNLGCFKEVPSKNRTKNIGGWIIELKGEEGKLISNSSEWIYY